MEKPVTLIIGLGETVGEALARRFLDAGQSVLAIDPSQQRLDDLKKTAGDKVERLHGAIHTRLGLRNALSAAMETFGRVDHIVAIPQLPPMDTLRTLDMDDFEAALAKSVRAAVETLRVFTDAMIEHRKDPASGIERGQQVGSFTFVLTLGAEIPNVDAFTENVTQHAIFGVVKAASLELAEEDIRANAIIALRPHSERREDSLEARTPMGRAAMGEEIAEAALFLSQPGVAIMTGQSIILDGGRQRLSGILTTDP